MDVTRFHRGRSAGRIAHVADDQTIEIGLVLLPVVLVLHVLEVAAAHPLLELPRTGGDRCVVGRIGDGIAAGIDVLGHDVGDRRAQGRREEELRRRIVVLEDNVVGVRRLDAREVGECRRDGILLPDLADGIDDVVDRHVLAVMELHAPADLHRVGLEIGRRLPRFGQHAFELAIHVALCQSLEQLRGGEGRARAAAGRYVAGLRLAAAPGRHQRTAPSGRALCKRSSGRGGHTDRQNARSEHAS